MSQPERYEPRARSIGGPWKMVKCKDGPYVCHEQHAEIVAALAADKQAADRATFDAIRAFTVLKDENAALQAENERLRKERDKLDFKESCEYKRREEWEKACIEARAENERLRKAGDACAVACRVMGSDTQADEWEAAKEVQS